MTLAARQGYSPEEAATFVLAQSLAQRVREGDAPAVGDMSQIDGGESIIGQILNVPGMNIPVTQRFGQRSKYDVFSGGINYGVDYGVGSNTPVTAPAGNWEVVEAKGGAKGKGYIGNKTNSGYGNTLVLRNTDTGESIRLSHLAKIVAQQGQKVKGGELAALSGQTGNVTGPHLDVEYRKPTGKLADITKTGYGQGLFQYKP